MRFNFTQTAMRINYPLRYVASLSPLVPLKRATMLLISPYARLNFLRELSLFKGA